MTGWTLALAAICLPLAAADTNADEVAQLRQRVTQLEKRVQEISEFLEPLKGQQATIASRRKALQPKINQRLSADRDKYSADDLVEAERLYSIISQKPDTKECADSYKTLTEKYPDNNRTGCAVLYMAQRATGEERIKNLQLCIEKYNNCIYGDSVQVGAYARFLLEKEYSIKGELKKAADLAADLKANYADAVDHAGNLLVDQAVMTAK